MAAPDAVPAELFVEPPANSDQAQALIDEIGDDDAVYFLLNVGDADCQLLLLPKRADGTRPVFVVDCYSFTKLESLLDDLIGRGVLPATAADGLELIVVGTHPHADHIKGVPKLLTTYGDEVTEYWDSGYRHTGSDYERLANALTDIHATVGGCELRLPAAGSMMHYGRTRTTVLAPAVRLRNLYDTYGVDVNDSSMVLKFEFPIGDLRQVDKDHGVPTSDLANRTTLLLGADAQTLSWSTVMTDFPLLHLEKRKVHPRLKASVDQDEPLSADIFKVSHHASKRGVNFELLERVAARVLLVSCSQPKKHYWFPHALAQELLREARQATAGSPGKVRLPDWALGIVYTCDTMAAGTRSADVKAARAFAKAADANPPAVAATTTDVLGSIAIVARPAKGKGTGQLSCWRLGDDASDPVSLAGAVRYAGPPFV